MPCYKPRRAVLVSSPAGRRLSFSRASVGKAISVPCNRCIGCRLERARQWAVRIMHEAKMHDENSFITLTYDDDHLPANRSVVVEDCQLFLKRLRARVHPKRIRFFLCAEYGEICVKCGQGRKKCSCVPSGPFEIGRPHYHAIIFGLDFPDKVRVKRSGEFDLYSSELLSAAWGNGSTSIGEVSFDTASYVASYAVKKIGGPKAKEHYKGRKPEFSLMSRGGRKAGGIGRKWIEKFGTDVYPSDEVIVKGRSTRPPRYYDKWFETRSPEDFEKIKVRREVQAEALEEFRLKSGQLLRISPGRNPWRLAVREVVAQAKAALKKRNMEME